MVKEDMVYIYKENAIQPQKRLESCHLWQLDGSWGPYAKSKEEERERQISYDITYMWNLNKGYKCTYLQNRNRVTDVENKLMITSG